MKTFLLILTLFLSSCSYIIKVSQLSDEKAQVVKKANLKKGKYCSPKKSSKILLTPSYDFSKRFNNFLKTKEVTGLRTVEKFVILSLLQLNLRPELSSPTSRFQVIYLNNSHHNSHHNSRYQYFDFFKSPDKVDSKNSDIWSFFSGLEKTLKSFKSKKSLKELIKISSKFKVFKTGPELALFFKENEKAFKSNKSIKKILYNGPEIKKENESLPVINLSKVYNEYRKNRKKHLKMTKKNSHLFKVKRDLQSKSQTFCNLDMNLYKNSIFLISKNILETNYFSIKENEDIFFGVLSQKPSRKKNLLDSLIFPSEGLTPPPGVCFVKSNNQTLMFASLNGRDPGQHLRQILELDTEAISNIEELSAYISIPRNLFLVNPPRMIYEPSEILNQNKTTFNSLGIPIYYKEKIGNIVSYISLKNKKLNSIYTDHRVKSSLVCE